MKKTVLAAVAAVLLSPSAHAAFIHVSYPYLGYDIAGGAWTDTGIYVSQPCPCSGAGNFTTSYTLGGAFFEATATISHFAGMVGNAFSVTMEWVVTALATVSADEPSGGAQAIAYVQPFFYFEIHQLVLYAGTGLRDWDAPWHAPLIPSGTILSPGDYSFSAFGGTGFVTAYAGQTSFVSASGSYAWAFVPVPAPGIGVLLLTGLVLMRVFRR
jgi:hypothetical protein